MSKPDVKFLAIVAVILLLCVAVPLMLVPKKKEGFMSENESIGMWFGIAILLLIIFAAFVFRVAMHIAS